MVHHDTPTDTSILFIVFFFKISEDVTARAPAGTPIKNVRWMAATYAAMASLRSVPTGVENIALTSSRSSSVCSSERSLAMILSCERGCAEKTAPATASPIEHPKSWRKVTRDVAWGTNFSLSANSACTTTTLAKKSAKTGHGIGYESTDNCVTQPNPRPTKIWKPRRRPELVVSVAVKNNPNPAADSNGASMNIGHTWLVA